MSTNPERLREIAASRGLRLVKGQGRSVGERDHGKYGLEDARTGHQVMGFGNRGVTASLAEVERFLGGNEEALWEASLKAGKTRKRPLSPSWTR
jgi:hypothetical protein